MSEILSNGGGGILDTHPEPAEVSLSKALNPSDLLQVSPVVFAGVSLHQKKKKSIFLFSVVVISSHILFPWVWKSAKHKV